MRFNDDLFDTHLLLPHPNLTTRCHIRANMTLPSALGRFRFLSRRRKMSSSKTKLSTTACTTRNETHRTHHARYTTHNTQHIILNISGQYRTHTVHTSNTSARERVFSCASSNAGCRTVIFVLGVPHTCLPSQAHGKSDGEVLGHRIGHV